MMRVVRRFMGPRELASTLIAAATIVGGSSWVSAATLGNILRIDHSKPTLVSASFNRTSLTQLGGPVIVTYKVASTKHCQFVVQPQPLGVAITYDSKCTSGIYTQKIMIPANPSALGITYSVVLRLITPTMAKRLTLHSIIVAGVNSPITANWTPGPVVESSLGAPTTLVCSSSTSCVAGDDNGNVFIETGGAWSNPRSVDPGTQITALSCEGATFCAAGDASGSALIEKSGNWTTFRGYANGPVTAVSCTSASFCVLGDSAGSISRYNGSSWSTDFAAFRFPVASVSCSSPTFCMAVDVGGNASRFNGTSWTAATRIESNSPTQIVCTDHASCLVVDDVGNSISFQIANFHWGTPVSVAPWGLTTLSCATATSCMASGSTGQTTTWNGTTWSSPMVAVNSPDSISAISCPTPSSCVLVDSLGNISVNSGSSWSPLLSFDHFGGVLTSVSCGSRSYCAFVDSLGQAAAVSSSGTESLVQVSSGSLNSVSCLDVYCVAVGSNGDSVSSDGLNWIDQPNVDTNPLLSVSCATTTSCFATDSQGFIVRLTGTAWSSPSSGGASFSYDSSFLGLVSTSCPSTTFCAAADRTGHELFYGASTSWMFKADRLGGAFTSISCTKSTFCIGVDASGYATSLTAIGPGSNNPAVNVRIDSVKLTSVSCPTATFCVATDDAGRVVYFINGAWSAPTQITNGTPLVGVSCISNRCLAISPTQLYFVTF